MEDQSDSHSQSSHGTIDLVSLTSSASETGNDNDDLSPMEEVPSQETENDSTNLCQKKRKGEKAGSPSSSKKPCPSGPSPGQDSENSGASPELVSQEPKDNQEDQNVNHTAAGQKTNQRQKKKKGKKQGKGKKGKMDETGSQSTESSDSNLDDHADPFQVISIRLLRCPSGKSGEEAVKSIMGMVNTSFEEVNLSANKLRKFEEDQQKLINSELNQKVVDFSQEETYNLLMYRQEVQEKKELEKLYAADPKPQIKHNYLLFYYREEEVFCIALGTGHKVIEGFSCSEFPERIMKRLCSDDMICSEQTTDVLDGSHRSFTSGTGKSSQCQSSLLKVYNYVEKRVQRNCSIYGLTAFKPKKRKDPVRN